MPVTRLPVEENGSFHHRNRSALFSFQTVHNHEIDRLKFIQSSLNRFGRRLCICIVTVENQSGKNHCRGTLMSLYQLSRQSSLLEALAEDSVP